MSYPAGFSSASFGCTHEIMSCKKKKNKLVCALCLKLQESSCCASCLGERMPCWILRMICGANISVSLPHTSSEMNTWEERNHFWFLHFHTSLWPLILTSSLLTVCYSSTRAGLGTEEAKSYFKNRWPEPYT